jgi:hypothetical protein
MKPFYLIVPLVSLLILGVLHYNHRHASAQHAEARIAQLKIEKETRARDEAAAREAALQTAMLAQEKRRLERVEKEQREKALREERQLALEARDQARREVEKITRLIDRDQKQLQEENESVSQLQTRRTSYQDRRAFLARYLVQARANLQKLQAVLVKVMPVQPPPPPAASPSAPAKS